MEDTPQRPPLPDLNALDVEALKSLVQAQHAELLSHQTEIERLRLLILKLKRMQFGRKSEKLDRQIEQLELQLEDLECSHSAELPAAPPMAAAPPDKPVRRPLPERLPRETKTYAPKEEICPDCGGALRRLGEDVSEILEYVPASFKVIRQVRPKLSCTRCERIVQQPAPSRPIERGLAGPGLLAHVLVSKYGDHLPLYRQAEIYEREGIESDRSTLAGWVGGASRLLGPLVEALRAHVLRAGTLHGDDTPVPVLAPGTGKTKKGRLRTYVRDGRPAGDAAAPAVWFVYSPDRKGEHPQQHLRDFRGILQADGYARFNRLYEAGQVTESACWAHYLDSVIIRSPVADTLGPVRTDRALQIILPTIWPFRRILLMTLPVSCCDEREQAVVRLWRSGHLMAGSISIYLQWVRRFRLYCQQHHLNETAELTLDGAHRFTHAYVGPRTKGPVADNSCEIAWRALRAWACALRSLRIPVPEWRQRRAPPPLPVLLKA